MNNPMMNPSQRRSSTVILLILITFAGLTAISLRVGRALAEPQKAPGDLFSGFRVIDLTHILKDGIPVYPGGEGFHLIELAKLEKQGFNLNTISTSEHVGTHVDAPLHFVADGLSIDSLGPGELIGPLVVLDVRTSAKESSDYLVGVDTIKSFESKHGQIPPQAFVVAWTGWMEKWSNPAAYVGKGPDQKLHFPGFSPEVTKLLVSERKIRGLGIDTLSIDRGISSDFASHKILLGANRIALENLTGLDLLPPVGSMIVVSPLRIDRGTGSPARIFAFVPKVDRRD